MMLFEIHQWRALTVAVALSFCGCEQLFDEGRSKNLEIAKKKEAAGDFQSAINHYEATLDGSSNSAEAHYRMALIYADKLRSPVDALHHFERYVTLAPRGTHGKEARAYRKEGEQKLLATLTKGTPVTQVELVRLKKDNHELRIALAKVRARKAAEVSTAPTPAGAKKADQQKQKPVPPGSRTHVVQSGETLAKIAVKYYKSKNRWKDIQDANFYSLDGTATIKPGMTLIIP